MDSPRKSDSSCKVAVDAACRSLKLLKVEYPIVQKKIKEWVENRQKIIQTIDHLEKKIDSIHTGATVVRGVGAAGGIVGGIMSLTGVVMAFKGAENATNLIKGGRAVGLISNVTSTSATLIELGYTQKIINEIKQELKEHDDLTELLSSWIQRSYMLDSVLLKIFGCSLLSDTIKNVMAVSSECIAILQIGENEANDLMEEYVSIKGGCERFLTTGKADLEEISEKVKRFLRILRDHPELRESLHKICNILQENPLLLEFSKLSLRVFFDTHIDASKDNFQASTANLDDVQASTGALLTIGAFEVVKIATDVMSLIFVAQDIKEGKSKYSEQLDLLKKGLSIELNAVLNNYPDLYQQLQQS